MRIRMIIATLMLMVSSKDILFPLIGEYDIQQG